MASYHFVGEKGHCFVHEVRMWDGTPPLMLQLGEPDEYYMLWQLDTSLTHDFSPANAIFVLDTIDRKEAIQQYLATGGRGPG